MTEDKAFATAAAAAAPAETAPAEQPLAPVVPIAAPRRALTGPEILALSRVTYAEVETPEVDEGAYVRIRNMTARHASAFLDTDPEKRAELLPGLLVQCVVNPDNSRVFTTEDEVQQFRDLRLGLFMRMVNKTFEISNMVADKKAPPEASIKNA